MGQVLFACSSLKDYVDAAQQICGTEIPVIYLDKKNHVEPSNMKQCILAEEKKLPPEVDTVLVAMGFCGGAWDHMTCSRRVVIPRVDDCVSLLLQRTDEYVPNLKEAGHLYMVEKDPEEFNFEKMLADQPDVSDGMSKELLFHMYFDSYKCLDIVDTGLTDCYSEEYAEKAQKTADSIGASLDYVDGGIHLLEKLVSGRWDKQFLVAEPGHLIRHGDFF